MRLLLLAIVLAATVACNDSNCQQQEVPMTWADGTVSTMVITVCVP